MYHSITIKGQLYIPREDGSVLWADVRVGTEEVVPLANCSATKKGEIIIIIIKQPEFWGMRNLRVLVGFFFLQ